MKAVTTRWCGQHKVISTKEMERPLGRTDPGQGEHTEDVHLDADAAELMLGPTAEVQPD